MTVDVLQMKRMSDFHVKYTNDRERGKERKGKENESIFCHCSLTLMMSSSAETKDPVGGRASLALRPQTQP